MWVYIYPNNIQTELKNAYIWIPDPTSIVLNKSSISLTTIWQTEQLTATIEPTVSDKTITWSSDDTTVATVSSSWLVTCVTPWTCTITATTVNGLTASCSVSPNLYQEVEWIGSSKTQYINTWFTPTVNTSIVTSLSLWSNNSWWAVFFWVTGNDSSNDWVLWRIYADTSWSFNPWFCNANYDETIAYISTDVFHDIELSANTLYIDGNSYTITTTWTPYQSSMDLFAWNNWWSHWWRKSSCKIKRFTIRDNWNLVRDFIPCYRISDWVIWMYDVVNGVFYTNNWGWTFSKWPDV